MPSLFIFQTLTYLPPCLACQIDLYFKGISEPFKAIKWRKTSIEVVAQRVECLAS